jgi:hypothetical protein
MPQYLILQILHRSFSTDKKKRTPVIQHTHFLWKHELTATLSSDEFENKKDQLISEPVFSSV